MIISFLCARIYLVDKIFVFSHKTIFEEMLLILDTVYIVLG